MGISDVLDVESAAKLIGNARKILTENEVLSREFSTADDMLEKRNKISRYSTGSSPSLSFGTPLNVGLLDVAFKIVGGAVTFGLIIIALRRKFERKFRH